MYETHCRYELVAVGCLGNYESTLVKNYQPHRNDVWQLRVEDLHNQKPYRGQSVIPQKTYCQQGIFSRLNKSDQALLSTNTFAIAKLIILKNIFKITG